MGVKRDKLLGKAGEELAVKFLKKKKYRVIERNYRSPFGEIDIIAWDGDTLSFVEVKARSSSNYGSPQAAVGGVKQGRLCRTALDYLAKRKIADVGMRFDVVAITVQGGAELIKNAFDYREPG